MHDTAKQVRAKHTSLTGMAYVPIRCICGPEQQLVDNENGGYCMLYDPPAESTVCKMVQDGARWCKMAVHKATERPEKVDGEVGVTGFTQQLCGACPSNTIWHRHAKKTPLHGPQRHRKDHFCTTLDQA